MYWARVPEVCMEAVGGGGSLRLKIRIIKAFGWVGTVPKKEIVEGVIIISIAFMQKHCQTIVTKTKETKTTKEEEIPQRLHRIKREKKP